MKWMGACLVTLGCTGLGQHMARDWRLRLKCLELLRQMMYLLKAEIIYGHTALGEALRRVGERCQKAEGERGLETMPLFSFPLPNGSNSRKVRVFPGFGRKNWKESRPLL